MSQIGNDPKYSFCAWFLFQGTISRKTSQVEKVPKTLHRNIFFKIYDKVLLLDDSIFCPNLFWKKTDITKIAKKLGYFEKWRAYQEVRGDGGEGLKGMAEAEA